VCTRLIIWLDYLLKI